MKHILLILMILSFLHILVFAQSEMLEITGAIVIQNAEIIPPGEGTIRWSGQDINAWDGMAWRSMTSEGLIYDADSNGYHVVAVGKQLWMKENLRTSTYADGTPIINEVINPTWQALTDGAFCWYNNDQVFEIPYGKLYNWYAVTDPKGLCPNGWRIPAESDFQELIDFLSASAGGGKMKEPGTTHWFQPNTGANNETNLHVVPGGYRSNTGSYISKGGLAFLWSSTPVGVSSAKFLQVRYNAQDLTIINSTQSFGNSIRCIKD